jgi:hypothetical protein
VKADDKLYFQGGFFSPSSSTLKKAICASEMTVLFREMHAVVSKKTEHFITTAVITLNSTS